MWGEILPELFLHHRFVIGPVADVLFCDGVLWLQTTRWLKKGVAVNLSLVLCQIP